jgi:hypothetical protein
VYNIISGDACSVAELEKEKQKKRKTKKSMT